MKNSQIFSERLSEDFLQLPISVRIHGTSKNLSHSRCPIVALNITFNSKIGLKDNKSCQNCNF